MIHVWPIYGALLIAVAIRIFGYADTYLRCAMLALVSDWIVSNLLHLFAPHIYRDVAPLIDVALATGFILCWFVFERQWMAVIAALYFISGLVGFLAYEPGSKYSFDLALNAAFLARLAVVWIASFEPRTLRNAHE